MLRAVGLTGCVCDSRWLRKTTNGGARWSRWVWVIGLTLLACIGLAIGLGVYSHYTNTSTVQSGPKAIGGSDNNASDADPTEAVQGAAVGESASATPTSSKHVWATYTVEKREAFGGAALETGVPVPVPTGHKKQRAKRSAAGLNRLD